MREEVFLTERTTRCREKAFSGDFPITHTQTLICVPAQIHHTIFVNTVAAGKRAILSEDKMQQINVGLAACLIGGAQLWKKLWFDPFCFRWNHMRRPPPHLTERGTLFLPTETYLQRA